MSRQWFQLQSIRSWCAHPRSRYSAHRPAKPLHIKLHTAGNGGDALSAPPAGRGPDDVSCPPLVAGMGPLATTAVREFTEPCRLCASRQKYNTGGSLFFLSVFLTVQISSHQK